VENGDLTLLCRYGRSRDKEKKGVAWRNREEIAPERTPREWYLEPWAYVTPFSGKVDKLTAKLANNDRAGGMRSLALWGSNESGFRCVYQIMKVKEQ